MSEFECKNGHMMLSREQKCRVCGSPVYTMDGMTGRQLIEMERREYCEEYGGDEDYPEEIIDSQEEV